MPYSHFRSHGVWVLAGVLRYRIAQNNITIQEIRSMDSAMIYQREFVISAIIYVLTCGYLPLVTFVLLMIQWLVFATRENSARFFGKVWSDSPVFFRNSENRLRGQSRKQNSKSFGIAFCMSFRYPGTHHSCFARHSNDYFTIWRTS